MRKGSYAIILVSLVFCGMDRAHAQTIASKASAEPATESRFQSLLAQTRRTMPRVFSIAPSSLNANTFGAERLVTPTTAGPNSPVVGSGALGHLTKWSGLTSSNSLISDSTIFEDKAGLIGIGTETPTSRLTVHGIIETTLGGYKFPDGTLQATAGIAFVTHDATLTGLGTPVSPLGIAPGGVQTVHLANAAVTGPKIAASAVGTSQLADSSVIESKIAAGAVGTSQIANSAVVQTKIAAGAVGTSQLADNSVIQAKIASGAVGTSELANGAITSSRIANGVVARSVNGLTDNVMLTAGANITITPSGNTLTIASTSQDAALTAFQFATDVSIPDGEFGFITTIPIPANKRLVIEYLACSIGAEELGGVEVFLTTHLGNGGMVRHTIKLAQDKDRPIFFTNNLVRIYADDSVQLQVSAIGPGGGSLSIVGHLVNLP